FRIGNKNATRRKKLEEKLIELGTPQRQEAGIRKSSYINRYEYFKIFGSKK
ncbi:15219_t:CDS:1, partial [Gigaspora margarita]